MNNTAISIIQGVNKFITFAIKYTVFLGRKFPFLAVVIILLYGIFFYQTFLKNPSTQSNLPLPTESQSTSPTSSTNPASVINNQLQQQAEIEEKLKEQEIAKLEEKQRLEKQKRIESAQAVFKKGSVFNGDLIYGNDAQPIRIEVSAVVGSTYVLEISNPKQGASQIFEGQLVHQFTHESLKYNSPTLSAILSLKSRSPQNYPENVWRFYRYQTTLILIPQELGIDGLADSLVSFPVNPWDYSIVIRNEN